MKILAIEASGNVAGAAYYCDGRMIAEFNLNFELNHSETLMNIVDNVCKMSRLSLDELDGIAFSAGPGSFTGLRIGAATAKGLALALNKPLIGVPTLPAMAYNMFMSRGIICPIMDARRKEVYSGIYTFDSDAKLITLMEEAALPFSEILHRVTEYNQPAVFLGDALPLYKDEILENPMFSLAPAGLDVQRAGSVACLAADMLKKGNIPPSELIYLRKPQAEREREQRLAAGEHGGIK